MFDSGLRNILLGLETGKGTVTVRDNIALGCKSAFNISSGADNVFGQRFWVKCNHRIKQCIHRRICWNKCN